MDQLTSNQLSEWEAYDRLDPIGSWREDYRMASIESTLINIHNAANVSEGAKMEATTASDFLPIWDTEQRAKIVEKRRRTQSIEEMKQAMMSFSSSHNKSEELKEQHRNRVPTLKIKK